ncbi:MAG: hypothetical protein KTR32_13625 [Granulosicoccus sp.]|nr:hypothetical protein [Granulosicoccus sp.]
MTVITKIELIETWLLIWTGHYSYRSRLLGALLLMVRYSAIVLFAAITAFVVGRDLPSATHFAINAGLTFTALLLAFFVIALIQIVRTGNVLDETWNFLNRLTLSTTFALPVLVAWHYGVYALPLVVIPILALATELLLKARLTREFMVVALSGCATVGMVAL